MRAARAAPRVQVPQELRILAVELYKLLQVGEQGGGGEGGGVTRGGRLAAVGGEPAVGRIEQRHVMTVGDDIERKVLVAVCLPDPGEVEVGEAPVAHVQELADVSDPGVHPEVEPGQGAEAVDPREVKGHMTLRAVPEDQRRELRREGRRLQAGEEGRERVRREERGEERRRRGAGGPGRPDDIQFRQGREVREGTERAVERRDAWVQHAVDLHRVCGEVLRIAEGGVEARDEDACGVLSEVGRHHAVRGEGGDEPVQRPRVLPERLEDDLLAVGQVLGVILVEVAGLQGVGPRLPEIVGRAGDGRVGVVVAQGAAVRRVADRVAGIPERTGGEVLFVQRPAHELRVLEVGVRVGGQRLDRGVKRRAVRDHSAGGGRGDRGEQGVPCRLVGAGRIAVVGFKDGELIRGEVRPPVGQERGNPGEGGRRRVDIHARALRAESERNGSAAARRFADGAVTGACRAIDRIGAREGARHRLFLRGREPQGGRITRRGGGPHDADGGAPPRPAHAHVHIGGRVADAELTARVALYRRGGGEGIRRGDRRTPGARPALFRDVAPRGGAIEVVVRPRGGRARGADQEVVRRAGDVADLLLREEREIAAFAEGGRIGERTAVIGEIILRAVIGIGEGRR